MHTLALLIAGSVGGTFVIVPPALFLTITRLSMALTVAQPVVMLQGGSVGLLPWFACAALQIGK